MEHYKNLSLENIIEEIDGIIYTEEWEPVLGYEKFYEISSMGRVKTLGRDSGKVKNKVWVKILKQSFMTKGYVFVALYGKDGKSKQKTIHRLVATAFIPNPENKPEVNHLFGIKTDNRKRMLAWNTVSENRKHAHDIGLKKANKGMLGKFGSKHHNSKVVAQYDLDGNFIKKYFGTREAQRETGIDQVSISRACRGIIPRASIYKWKYV